MHNVIEFRDPASEAASERPAAAPPSIEPIWTVVDSLSRTLDLHQDDVRDRPRGPIRDKLEAERANLVIGLFVARVAAMRVSSGDARAGGIRCAANDGRWSGCEARLTINRQTPSPRPATSKFELTSLRRGLARETAHRCDPGDKKPDDEICPFGFQFVADRPRGTVAHIVLMQSRVRDKESTTVHIGSMEGGAAAGRSDAASDAGHGIQLHCASFDSNLKCRQRAGRATP